jgi:transposase-like protein
MRFWPLVELELTRFRWHPDTRTLTCVRKGVDVPNRYTYTPEFKQEAVRLYRMSERGYAPCARKLGIAVSTLALRWYGSAP